MDFFFFFFFFFIYLLFFFIIIFLYLSYLTIISIFFATGVNVEAGMLTRGQHLIHD